MWTCFLAGLVVALATLAAAPARAETAQRPDVVLVVLDELPVDSLLRADGQIDAAAFPGFAQLARSSTWFPNAHSIYDSTHHALPALLDGRLPTPRTPSTSGGHPANVFDVFGRRGWRIDAREEGSSLCSRRWCPRRRVLRSRDVKRNLAGGRAKRMRAGLDSILPGPRPTFFFRHLLLPHEPWVYLPSGRHYDRGFDDLKHGFSSERSFHDPFLSVQARQRHLLQLSLVDGALSRLIARLRASGAWDRTLLAVTADHGIAFEPGVRDRRRVDASTIDEIAPVPLFVKAPGQRAGGIDRAIVRTTDVVPTIARILGLRLGWRRSGRSAFSRRVRRRRTVRMMTRDMRTTLAVGAGEHERRRRANRVRFAEQFRYGPWGIGPHPELLGRRVAELRPGKRGRGRAYFDGRGPLLMDPASDFVPSWATGRIRGDARRRRRDLALAVNGLVVAVGTSVRLRGSSVEGFALLFPEWALRPGANRRRLYAVRAVRGRLRLRAL